MVTITESRFRNSFVNVFDSICDVGFLMYDSIIYNYTRRVILPQTISTNDRRAGSTQELPIMHLLSSFTPYEP